MAEEGGDGARAVVIGADGTGKAVIVATDNDDLFGNGAARDLGLDVAAFDAVDGVGLAHGLEAGGPEGALDVVCGLCKLGGIVDIARADVDAEFVKVRPHGIGHGGLGGSNRREQAEAEASRRQTRGAFLAGFTSYPDLAPAHGRRGCAWASFSPTQNRTFQPQATGHRVL